MGNVGGFVHTPVMDTMAAADRRRVEVTIPGRPKCERVLTGSQAEGWACIGCSALGDELVPVGVVFPPTRKGNGVARACPGCAPGTLGA